VLLNPGTPGERDLGKIDVHQMAAGDVICFLTPGGGGWGDPFLREPEAVAADVRAGFVSAAAAAADYGVVLRDGVPDVDATRAVRSSRPVSDAGAFRFDGGPERAWWDTAFPDALVDAFVADLIARPARQRETRRNAVYEAALGAGFAGLTALKAGSPPDAAVVAARFARAVETGA
jgi:N-methylhydantoinase B